MASSATAQTPTVAAAFQAESIVGRQQQANQSGILETVLFAGLRGGKLDGGQRMIDHPGRPSSSEVLTREGQSLLNPADELLPVEGVAFVDVEITRALHLGRFRRDRIQR